MARAVHESSEAAFCPDPRLVSTGIQSHLAGLLAAQCFLICTMWVLNQMFKEKFFFYPKILSCTQRTRVECFESQFSLGVEFGFINY